MFRRSARVAVHTSRTGRDDLTSEVLAGRLEAYVGGEAYVGRLLREYG
ncbi:hypothetical protein [Streptomyces sp. NPDC001809]